MSAFCSRSSRMAAVAIMYVVAAVAVQSCYGFYVQTALPNNIKQNTAVEMRVNKLESVNDPLSYRYYDLPFCAPDVTSVEHENLGEIFAGDSIENSLYEFVAGRNQYCKQLCQKSYKQEDADTITEFVRKEYTVNFILDSLPAAVLYENTANPEEKFYKRDFPLGYSTDDATYLNNHIHFRVLYNPNESEEGMRIVGFEVQAFSIEHKTESGKYEPGATLKTCNEARLVTAVPPELAQRIDQATDVIFTYDVEWVESNIAWTHRWDLYNKSGSGSDDIHWLSIVNSILIVLFLAGMIAMIVIRALYRDIAKYNEEQSLEAQAEETGWKLVHADVFRGPSGRFGPVALAVMVGSGVQILGMAVVVMILAAAGLLSPANRGAMMTAIVVVYIFMGSFNGYFCARIYKMYSGKAWKRTAIAAALFFPGIIAGSGFVLNLFVWAKGSSNAIPFGTMVEMLVLWLFVANPLVLLGAFFGFSKDTIEVPVKTNRFPRVIPAQPWYVHATPSCLVGGVLPFGCIFIELFFVMSSVWRNQTYVLYGFAALVVLLVIVTSAEIAVVMVYFQLCSEDYRWHWRAFLTPAASAVHLFLYSILYFATRLSITGFVPIVFYFSIMAMISFTFFLLTGAIGYLSTLLFVRKIYGAIKVD